MFKNIQISDRVGPECTTKYFNFESKYFVRKPIIKTILPLKPRLYAGPVAGTDIWEVLSTCKYERLHFVAVCLLFTNIVHNLQQHSQIFFMYRPTQYAIRLVLLMERYLECSALELFPCIFYVLYKFKTINMFRKEKSTQFNLVGQFLFLQFFVTYQLQTKLNHKWL